MKADVAFYHEDEDGNVRPRRPWVGVGQDELNRQLAPAPCVAIALTKLFCERGLGKVC
jgi:hypothetical protein